MNDNPLTENDLEQVSGGDAKCDTALNLSQGYGAIADVCLAVGATDLSMLYSGKAMGVLEGGCGRPGR